MNETSDKLLKAIDIVASKRVSELAFDRTVQAYIYELGNLDIGQYKVKYNDSIFDAYTEDLTKTYSIGENVYVKIPQSDFSNRKIIEGRCTNISSARDNSITKQKNIIAATSPDWSSFYKYDAAGAYGITAGATVKAGKDKLLIYPLEGSENISHAEFSQYAKNYDTFEIKAEFETQFHNIPGTDNYGNYGLEVCFFTTDGEVTYVLDKSNFNGNMYRFARAAEQSVIIKAQKNYLTGLKSIKLFEDFKDYDKTNNGIDIDTTPNIFVKNISLRYIELEELVDDLYYLRIAAVNGKLFTESIPTLTFRGELIYNGQSILNRASCKCYWYERDLSVTIDHADYDAAAGVGWRLISDSRHVDFNVLTAYRSEILYEKEYKLLVNYSNSVTITKTITVTNSDYGYNVIKYSAGETDNGEIAIRASRVAYDAESRELRVTPADKNVVSIADTVISYNRPIDFILVDYHIEQETVGNTVKLYLVTNYPYDEGATTKVPMANWYALYPDGNYKLLNMNGYSNSIVLNEMDMNQLAYEQVTYYAEIISPNKIDEERDLENIVAIRSLTIKNGENESDLTLSYNFTHSYNYDVNGDIDITYAEEPKLLDFNVKWKEGKASTWTIGWFDPEGRIIQPDSSAIELSNSMIEKYWVDKDNNLWYNIHRKFNAEATNNSINFVIVTADKQEYYYSKEIAFTKDGAKELNGKTYSVIVAPADEDGNKVNGYVGLTTNINDKLKLRAYVYEDGVLLNDLGTHKIDYDWELFNVVMTENSSSSDQYIEIKLNEIIATYHYVKLRVTLDDSITVYNFYSVDASDNPVGYTLDKNLVKINIPSLIEYNSSGFIPTYYSNAVECLYNNVVCEIESPIGSPVKVQNNKLSPTGYFDYKNSCGVLECKFPLKNTAGTEKIITIYHTIVLVMDRTGNELIDGWDGTQLTIDKDKGQYLYAPRIGAGTVKVDATGNKVFTGTVMGTTGEGLTGLFGYLDGIATFGLNTDGTAFLGPQGKGININGNSADIRGGLTSGGANYMRLNLTAEMPTDLAIQIVDENGTTAFSVDYRGQMSATGASINGTPIKNSDITGGSMTGATIKDTSITNGTVGNLGLQGGALVSEAADTVFDQSGMLSRNINIGYSEYKSSGMEQVGVLGYYEKHIRGGIGFLKDEEENDKFIGIQTVKATKIETYWEDEEKKEREVDDTMGISLNSAKDLYLLAARGTITTEEDGTETLTEVGGKIEIGDGTNEFILNVPAELQQGIYARFA